MNALVKGQANMQNNSSSPPFTFNPSHSVFLRAASDASGDPSQRSYNLGQLINNNRNQLMMLGFQAYRKGSSGGGLFANFNF